MSSSESSSGDEDYVEEPYEDDSLEIICLFCDKKEVSSELLLNHMNQVHHFLLREFCEANKFDSVLYIKFINYVRTQKVSVEQLSNLVTKNDWKADEYFTPVIQNDALLTLGMTDSDDEGDQEMINQLKSSPSPGEDVAEIHKKVDFLESEIERLKYLIKEINNLDEEDEARRSRSNDDFFFWTYNHHEIHYEMLSDRVRTESYQSAIKNNSSLIQGKSCLDIGCGTGILSFFCSSAGASKVVAVDQSDIIYAAMDIAEENGISRKIDFRKGRVEELDFDAKFDVIVSEWMGYFLLFEGMLDTIIRARDRLLKPNGLLLPSQASLYGAAVYDKELYEDKISFWNDVYGYRMSTLKSDVIDEVHVMPVTSESIISSAVILKDFNLYTCTLEDAQKVDQEFQLKIVKNGIIHAFVVWFDCLFDLDNPVTLSTSPHSQLTHWKQSLLFLETPLTVKENDLVSGRIIVTRTEDNFRSLRIKLQLGDNKVQKYTII